MLAGVDIENYNAESDWKTEDPQGSGGSNPSPSGKQKTRSRGSFHLLSKGLIVSPMFLKIFWLK